jgi:hypothetical protein
MADDNLTFEMPQGFSPPENLDSDDTFQAMATFRVVGNDQLELVDVDGYQVGEGEEEEEEGGGPTAAATEAANAASAMQPQGAGGGGPPNMSEDRIPPGAPPQQVGGFAEQMGQRFKRAMAVARPRGRG